MNPFRIAVVTALALTAATSLASAEGSLSVSPVRLDIGSHAMSGVLVVANDGDTAVDAIAVPYHWSQTADKPQVLEDAPDIAVFPRQFHLEPYARRTLRIGTLKASDGQERAYRIIVTQLPSERGSATQANGLRFATRFSIPVFVGGDRGGSVALQSAAVHDASLSLTLGGPATRHAYVRSAHVDALDAAGGVLASADIGGWYVLPASSQRWQGRFGSNVCRRIASLHVHGTDDEGSALDVHVTPERTCSARP